MRRFSLLHAIWMSFFSKELYRDVGRNWGNLPLLYLLFLLALTWIPTVIQLDSAARKFMRDKGPKIIEQVPRITIHDGQATADVQQPHCIEYPDDGRCVVLIDTTGNTPKLEGTRPKVLLTKTELIYYPNDSETRVYRLEGIKNLTIDPDSLAKWLQISARLVAVSVFAVAVTFSFCFRFLQALLDAVVALVFTRVRGIKLDFGTLRRIAVVALTPVIITQAALDLFGIEIRFARLAFLTMAIGYLFFGVNAYAESTSGEPSLPDKDPEHFSLKPGP